MRKDELICQVENFCGYMKEGELERNVSEVVKIKFRQDTKQLTELNEADVRKIQNRV